MEYSAGVEALSDEFHPEQHGNIISTLPTAAEVCSLIEQNQMLVTALDEAKRRLSSLDESHSMIQKQAEGHSWELQLHKTIAAIVGRYKDHDLPHFFLALETEIMNLVLPQQRPCRFWLLRRATNQVWRVSTQGEQEEVDLSSACPCARCYRSRNVVWEHSTAFFPLVSTALDSSGVGVLEVTFPPMHAASPSSAENAMTEEGQNIMETCETLSHYLLPVIDVLDAQKALQHEQQQVEHERVELAKFLHDNWQRQSNMFNNQKQLMQAAEKGDQALAVLVTKHLGQLLNTFRVRLLLADKDDTLRDPLWEEGHEIEAPDLDAASAADQSPGLAWSSAHDGSPPRVNLLTPVSAPAPSPQSEPRPFHTLSVTCGSNERRMYIIVHSRGTDHVFDDLDRHAITLYSRHLMTAVELSRVHKAAGIAAGTATELQATKLYLAEQSEHWSEKVAAASLQWSMLVRISGINVQLFHVLAEITAQPWGLSADHCSVLLCESPGQVDQLFDLRRAAAAQRSYFNARSCLHPDALVALREGIVTVGQVDSTLEGGLLPVAARPGYCLLCAPLMYEGSGAGWHEVDAEKAGSRISYARRRKSAMGLLMLTADSISESREELFSMAQQQCETVVHLALARETEKGALHHLQQTELETGKRNRQLEQSLCKVQEELAIREEQGWNHAAEAVKAAATFESLHAALAAAYSYVSEALQAISIFLLPQSSDVGMSNSAVRILEISFERQINSNGGKGAVGWNDRVDRTDQITTTVRKQLENATYRPRATDAAGLLVWSVSSRDSSTAICVALHLESGPGGDNKVSKESNDHKAATVEALLSRLGSLGQWTLESVARIVEATRPELRTAECQTEEEAPEMTVQNQDQLSEEVLHCCNRITRATAPEEISGALKSGLEQLLAPCVAAITTMTASELEMQSLRREVIRSQESRRYIDAMREQNFNQSVDVPPEVGGMLVRGLMHFPVMNERSVVTSIVSCCRTSREPAFSELEERTATHCVRFAESALLHCTQRVRDMERSHAKLHTAGLEMKALKSDADSMSEALRMKTAQDRITSTILDADMAWDLCRRMQAEIGRQLASQAVMCLASEELQLSCPAAREKGAQQTEGRLNFSVAPAGAGELVHVGQRRRTLVQLYQAMDAEECRELDAALGGDLEFIFDEVGIDAPAAEKPVTVVSCTTPGAQGLRLFLFLGRELQLEYIDFLQALMRIGLLQLRSLLLQKQNFALDERCQNATKKQEWTSRVNMFCQQLAASTTLRDAVLYFNGNAHSIFGARVARLYVADAPSHSLWSTPWESEADERDIVSIGMHDGLIGDMWQHHHEQLDAEHLERTRVRVIQRVRHRSLAAGEYDSKRDPRGAMLVVLYGSNGSPVAVAVAFDPCEPNIHFVEQLQSNLAAVSAAAGPMVARMLRCEQSCQAEESLTEELEATLAKQQQLGKHVAASEAAIVHLSEALASPIFTTCLHTLESASAFISHAHAAHIILLPHELLSATASSRRASHTVTKLATTAARNIASSGEAPPVITDVDESTFVQCCPFTIEAPQGGRVCGCIAFIFSEEGSGTASRTEISKVTEKACRLVAALVATCIGSADKKQTIQDTRAALDLQQQRNKELAAELHLEAPKLATYAALLRTHSSSGEGPAHMKQSFMQMITPLVEQGLCEYAIVVYRQRDHLEQVKHVTFPVKLSKEMRDVAPSSALLTGQDGWRSPREFARTAAEGSSLTLAEAEIELGFEVQNGIYQRLGEGRGDGGKTTFITGILVMANVQDSGERVRMLCSQVARSLFIYGWDMLRLDEVAAKATSHAHRSAELDGVLNTTRAELADASRHVEQLQVDAKISLEGFLRQTEETRLRQEKLEARRDAQRKTYLMKRSAFVFRSRTLSRAVRTWRENVRCIRHQRVLLGRYSSRLRKGKMFHSFATWHSQVRVHRRNRRVVSQCVLAMQRRALHMCMATWASFTSSEKSRRIRLRRALINVALAKRRVGLRTWKQYTAEQRQVQRAGFWMSRRTLMRCLRTWASQCVERKRLKKLLQRFLMLRTAKAFHGWRSNATRRIQVRRLADRHLRRWLHNSLRRAIVTWRKLVDTRIYMRQQLTRLFRNVKTWRHQRVERSFLTWYLKVTATTPIVKIIKMWKTSTMKRSFLALARHAHRRTKVRRRLRLVALRRYQSAVGHAWTVWQGLSRSKAARHMASLEDRVGSLREGLQAAQSSSQASMGALEEEKVRRAEAEKQLADLEQRHAKLSRLLSDTQTEHDEHEALVAELRNKVKTAHDRADEACKELESAKRRAEAAEASATAATAAAATAATASPSRGIRSTPPYAENVQTQSSPVSSFRPNLYHRSLRASPGSIPTAVGKVVEKSRDPLDVRIQATLLMTQRLDEARVLKRIRSLVSSTTTADGDADAGRVLDRVVRYAQEKLAIKEQAFLDCEAWLRSRMMMSVTGTAGGEATIPAGEVSSAIQNLVAEHVNRCERSQEIDTTSLEGDLEALCSRTGISLEFVGHALSAISAAAEAETALELEPLLSALESASKSLVTSVGAGSYSSASVVLSQADLDEAVRLAHSLLKSWASSTALDTRREMLRSCMGQALSKVGPQVQRRALEQAADLARSSSGARVRSRLQVVRESHRHLGEMLRRAAKALLQVAADATDGRAPDKHLDQLFQMPPQDFAAVHEVLREVHTKASEVTSAWVDMVCDAVKSTRLEISAGGSRSNDAASVKQAQEIARNAQRQADIEALKYERAVQHIRHLRDVIRRHLSRVHGDLHRLRGIDDVATTDEPRGTDQIGGASGLTALNSATDAK